jgi:hypothetical protein
LIGQDAVDVMGPPELRACFDLLDKEEGLGSISRKRFTAATIFR